METILCLAHTESDGTLSRVALEAMAAAKWLAGAVAGSTLCVGLVGEKTEAAAGQAGSSGAARFLSVSGPEFGQSRYASDAAAAEALCRAADATVVIVPSTSRWARCLAGVAQRLNGVIDSHVTGLSADGDKPAVSRWYYRQRMEAVLERTRRPWMILLESGVFPALEATASPVSVEPVAVELPDSAKRTQFAGIRAPQTDEQTIRPDANLLFVAGAGWTKKQADGQVHASEAASSILDFLHKTQASLGSSKSLVDLSGEGQAVLPFLTHLNQIGQTGSTPRHPKGLATCCHGEEPHVVGWRFVNERRAVNLDPNCGWARGKADVLYVADAFKVVAKVNELLGK
ncbi:MAG: electron transfer flavoprotein subunit alpha [Bryobacteraceae bacterium]